AGQGEPAGGPQVAAGSAAGTTGGLASAGCHRRDGRALVRDHACGAELRDHRPPRPAAHRAGSGAVPGRPGGAGQRGSARAGFQGRRNDPLHRRPGAAGRTRPRCPLHPRRGERIRAACDGPAPAPRRRQAGGRECTGGRHSSQRQRPGHRCGWWGMSANAPIRLLIVDDHPVVRDGLRGIFAVEAGVDVVGEAQDGAEAVTRARELQPDVVLMDLRMPVMGGVEAIGRLRQTVPRTRVLVLTTYDADHDVLPAVEAGATGYLLKDAPRDELVRAVRAAFRGEPVLSPSVAGRLMGRVRRPPEDELSQRELEVLRLVAGGAGNREAAARLFVSEATIKTHLLHVYSKLGVRDRAAAVGEAYRRKLLQ